jgi:cytidine diphosphoramidate kinase
MKDSQSNKKIFWITGLSGSGKSSIGRVILPKIKRKFGNTILINGDDIRDIFNLKTYDRSFRVNIGKYYFNLCMFLLKQNFNVIFTVVGLWHEVQKYNRLKGKNRYVEIFIEADIKKLVKRKSKFFYRKKVKNVVGLNIKPEFPKKPDIKIKNNFNKTISELSKEIFSKINDKFN